MINRRSKKVNSEIISDPIGNLNSKSYQINLADAWGLNEEERKEFLRPTNRNTDIIFDFIDFDDELKKIKKKDLDDFIKLRSEQIYINEPYYNKIFSILCRYSKNIYNSSIYQIIQSIKKNFDYNYHYDNNELVSKEKCTNEEKELRSKIHQILNKGKKNDDGIFIRDSGYQHEIYKLLDSFFRETNNENYISIPQQTSQQSIKLACDALYSNDQSKINFKYHPWDYTGEPGDIGYKKEGRGSIRGESIAILTNQQCNVELKNKYIKKKILYKFCLTFPSDLRKSLNIDILTTETLIIKLDRLGLIFRDEYRRIKWKIDLRQIRIIPQKIGYKLEIVYKNMMSEKIKNKIERLIENFKIESKVKDQDRLMGIDINVNNISVGCLEIEPYSNKIKQVIGNHPILLNTKKNKSINQRYNKEVASLYSIYMRQQGFDPNIDHGKGQKVRMGRKFYILTMKRDNFLRDVFHKISNFILKYCLKYKIRSIWKN